MWASCCLTEHGLLSKHLRTSTVFLIKHAQCFQVVKGFAGLQVATLTDQITSLEAEKVDKAAALATLHAEHEEVKAAAAKSGVEATDREAQLSAQLSALQERLDALTKEAETSQTYQQELEGAHCFSPFHNEACSFCLFCPFAVNWLLA
jgi:hypothetical protein